jgi:hypothetical protein
MRLAVHQLLIMDQVLYYWLTIGTSCGGFQGLVVAAIFLIDRERRRRLQSAATLTVTYTQNTANLSSEWLPLGVESHFLSADLRPSNGSKACLSAILNRHVTTYKDQYAVYRGNECSTRTKLIFC